MAGISGTAAQGADSIVLNGGYEDDEDHGTVVIYTGHGGNDPQTKSQIADQEFVKGNAGLAVSADQGLPVRVVRGPKGNPAHSPSSGYRYDGIYRVDDWWSEIGISGYRIFRFRLIKEPTPDPRTQRQARHPTVTTSRDTSRPRGWSATPRSPSGSKSCTSSRARSAASVSQPLAVHMRRAPISGRAESRTAAQTCLATSCACARTIMSYWTEGF